MVITKDLGAVSAYAYAVEQGYQGTEEEFAELMARQATVAEEAAASADAAAESASEAQASAEQAEQSAQSISGDVERAEQAATTASGKATEAATSATTANGAAQTATGKAAQAEQSATAAANSASAAATSASNAASSATAAQTAQTAAETAQGKAEDAQAAAEAAAASIDPDTLVKKTELEDYARIDGSYETMTVGNAEQLVSTVGIDDKVPYLFRTSGGSADIGDRETDKIVGGTVAWNQLWDEDVIPTESALYSANSYTANGVTFTKNGDGSISIQTTAEGATARASVKIAASATSSDNAKKSAFSYTMQNRRNLSRGCPYGSGTTYWLEYSNRAVYGEGYISEPNNSGFNYWLVVGEGTIITTPVKVYPQFYDLDLMFGTTIAAYLTSMGTGVNANGAKWFNKMFPKPYYAYNAGELLSVNTSQHKMVGFNAYNPTTGTAHVVGGMQYQITGAYTALTIDGETVTPDASGFFTPSADGTLTVTGGNSSTTCVHLVWDGERDDTYEPYQEWVYPLDSSLTLRGITKLDASNNLYYDGDTYESDGTVTRRYGIVDLGTLNWVYNSTYNFFMAKLLGKANGLGNGIAQGYTYDDWWSYWNDKDKVWCGNLNNDNLVFKNTAYSDATAFKTAMSGVYLVYELAASTTEFATGFINPQNVDDFGTEEYVTDSIVPVGHETFYQANLKAKLEMAPNSPDGDGDYVVRQANGLNSYVPLAQVRELPDLPTEDGTYVLKATVSSGTPTYTWVSDAESEG